MSSKNFVFVVCHPDDEVIWVGGLICELSRMANVRCHVVCLSGKDPNSAREREFQEARKVAGFATGAVMGGALRPALAPLPETSRTFQAALVAIGLQCEQIDLLITHSPYGDEMGHPHHRQAHIELRRWANRNKVSFACFSCVPMPYFAYRSILLNPVRNGSLQIVGAYSCERSFSFRKKILNRRLARYIARPKYFIQFLASSEGKSKMLECYKSIDVEMHRRGYVMATSSVEALYFYDENGASYFLEMIKSGQRNGAPDLFGFLDLRKRLSLKLKSLLNARRSQ